MVIIIVVHCEANGFKLKKEVCLTWFFPTVTAQGLRRAKEYARLGLQSATLQLEIDHITVASCHMGEP